MSPYEYTEVGQVDAFLIPAEVRHLLHSLLNKTNNLTCILVFKQEKLLNEC